MVQTLSALPGAVVVDQSASLFDRLEAGRQELQQEERAGGPKFWQRYLRDERSLRTVNMGEEFTMTPFQWGASVVLRTVLRHLFEILYACNDLAPHRDHFSLLLLAPKFRKTAKVVFDRAYDSVIRAQVGTRIRVFFESMLAAYVDPNMLRLLKRFKSQTLDSWTEAMPVYEIREAVLDLMHEWAQAVEDTTTAPGLRRLDGMTEKMWLEELEGVWPDWVSALCQTDQHQFGNTVEELFHFLQTRETDRPLVRSCVPMTVSATDVRDFAHMSVEEALHMVTSHQLCGLLAFSRQVRC